MGTLQGEEGEAQKLEQLACLYISYQLDTLSVTLLLAGAMTASLMHRSPYPDTMEVCLAKHDQVLGSVGNLSLPLCLAQ